MMTVSLPQGGLAVSPQSVLVRRKALADCGTLWGPHPQVPDPLGMNRSEK